MQRDLLFGTGVELQDGSVRLAGVWIDDEWSITAVAIEKGFILKWVARASADQFRKDSEHLAIDARWPELEAFDAHAQPQDPHLLMPVTRIRLVERGSLTQDTGDVLGVVANEDFHVEQLIVELKGHRVLVPLTATLMQSQHWVYVDMTKMPGAQFPEYQAKAAG